MLIEKMLVKSKCMVELESFLTFHSSSTIFVSFFVLVLVVEMIYEGVRSKWTNNSRI